MKLFLHSKIIELLGRLLLINLLKVIYEDRSSSSCLFDMIPEIDN